MFDSKSIISPQNGPHPRLHEIVTKHIEKPYLKPIQEHNRRAFKRFLDAIQAHTPHSLILDSCCGTGMSTRKIAQANKHAFVIGIDQSASRLMRKCDQTDSSPDNMLLLQTNCEDFWRLCVEAKLRFEKHYILYPNPYPKAEHFKRRWHGHPSFPALAELSTNIELRSNWPMYLIEFQQAWELLSGRSSEIRAFEPEDPLTLFERKYSGSGQTLFKLSSSDTSNDVKA